MLKLLKSSVQYKKGYIEAEKEFVRKDGRKNIDFKKLANDFEGFLRVRRDYERGEKLPKGHVPTSFYWLVDGKKFIGEVNIRHRLTKNLQKMGGHIGYRVRPSERKKGFGKKILALALKKAKALKLKKVLLTCDDKNTGSWKIIESNGGVLKKKAQYKGKLKRYYWIKIK